MTPRKYNSASPNGTGKTTSLRSAFLFLTTVILLSVMPPALPVYPDEMENKLKAAFIQKFIDFVEWPESSIKSSQNFRIGILGTSSIASYISKGVANKQFQGKSIEVKRLQSMAEIPQCHMIFISASEKDSLYGILSLTRKKAILTIGDTAKFADMGVLINLYRQGDYIRFEINIDEVYDSGLKVSSKLLKLSKIVGMKGVK